MKRIAIRSWRTPFSAMFVSIELEEVVFDETNCFCNDFHVELEEAVFR